VFDYETVAALLSSLGLVPVNVGLWRSTRRPPNEIAGPSLPGGVSWDYPPSLRVRRPQTPYLPTKE